MAVLLEKEPLIQGKLTINTDLLAAEAAGMAEETDKMQVIRMPKNWFTVMVAALAT